MVKQPKISVIIPVYNVEKYLSQCLDSVLGQDLNDIEVICINDGSKDGSLEILKQYQSKDDRLVVIDKKNEGVSVARNKGLEAAKGKYVAFLDGDDFFEPNCFEKIYQKAESFDVDVFVFGHVVFDSGEKIVWENPYLDGTEGKLPWEGKAIYLFMACVWGRLYRLDFLKKHKLEFPIGIKIAEDTIFNVLCYLKKPTIAYTTEKFYDYRMNRIDSAMSDFSCVQKEVDAFNCLESFAEFQEQPSEIKLKIIEKFISGIEAHLNRFNLRDNPQYMKIRRDFVRSLEKKYGAVDIRKMVHIKDLSWGEKLFSIKNSACKKYKIIHLLGMRFQLKRKKK